MKKLSLEEKVAAFYLRQTGLTYEAISKDLGVSKNSIWALLNRTNIKELVALAKDGINIKSDPRAWLENHSTVKNNIRLEPELSIWLEGYSAELGMTSSKILNILVAKERRKAEREKDESED